MVLWTSSFSLHFCEKIMVFQISIFHKLRKALRKRKVTSNTHFLFQNGHFLDFWSILHRNQGTTDRRFSSMDTWTNLEPKVKPEIFISLLVLAVAGFVLFNYFISPYAKNKVYQEIDKLNLQSTDFARSLRSSWSLERMKSWRLNWTVRGLKMDGLRMWAV